MRNVIKPDSSKTEDHEFPTPPTTPTPTLVDQLITIFYDELKRLAHRERARVGAGATLCTTALVNVAYLKLRRSGCFNDDAHFMRTAAMAMRQALVNHAVQRLTEKRGGGATTIALDTIMDADASDDQSLLALHDALAALSQHMPRLAQVVECRYFAGYSDLETAQALALSERTVRRDWTLARAWLHRSLQARA